MSAKRKAVETSGGDSKKPKANSSITAFFGAPKVTAAKPVEFDKDKWVSGLSTEQKDLLKLEIDTLHESWLAHLKDDLTKADFLNLKRFLKKEKEAGKKVFPPEQDIYSWCVLPSLFLLSSVSNKTSRSRHTPLDKVKVVILGQDRMSLRRVPKEQ